MEMIEIDEDNVEDFSDYIDMDLQNDMDREFFQGIGAVDDDEIPLGALVYELKDSESEEDTKSRIWVLKADDIEIVSGLLSEYVDVMEEEEVTESFFESSDQEMAELLKENGFSLEISESPDISIGADVIRKMPVLDKVKKIPNYIVSLSEITLQQYRAFAKECLFREKRGLLEDFAYLPKSWFEPDISACVITDDKVQGWLLMRKSASGTLSAMFYIAFGPDYQKNLIYMLAYTAQKILEQYPEDTKVVVRRHNALVHKLTKKLFADVAGKQIYTGKRREG